LPSLDTPPTAAPRRLRFGRFFYRFPNGESGADVFDRITIFEDHLVRDINAGRFSSKTSLVLITHGLALRIFLMRWLHWTVDQFLEVYNPPNSEVRSEVVAWGSCGCCWCVLRDAE
jgi:broad specificity phosphatase PhoE